MERDPEIDAWSRQWQSQDDVPPDLRGRVARDIRAIRRGTFASIAVTIVFGGGALAQVLMSPETEVVALAVAVWIFIAVTWAVAMWMERGGPKRPASMTTAAYLDFRIYRCRAGRRTLGAAVALGLPWVVFMLGYRWMYSEPDAPPLALWTHLTSARVVIAAVVTTVLSVLALWRRRVLLREMQYLTMVRQEVGDASSPASAVR